MYGPHLGPFPFELTENMRIGIVCKVIDNFGDAGFSLRLAKALALEGHSVTLFHDSSTTFNALIPDQNIHGLELVDATQGLGKAENTQWYDLLLEPFGSSSEQTEHRFDLRLKKTHHSTPWLLIDYLSSEDWVENFHLQSSVDPKSGHVTTFFYPGFTPRTGGLIHADFPSHLRDGQEKTEEDGLKVFVFAYSNAPVLDLLVSCEIASKTGAEIQIGLASWKWPTGESSTKFQCMTPLPFCPQSEFDDLLARYDVLFVRGEDSFVRAQLAGKPFIWQIYATQDNAHAAKLASFFHLYRQGLGEDCAAALWKCWSSWNRLDDSKDFSDSWKTLNSHWPELRTHAKAWQKKLFDGPELVKEVLTWHGGQTPTLIEKPDL